MGQLALTIGIIIVVFILGYWMGFRACFEYLTEELENYKKDHR